jgi:hypothetical protein
LFAVPMGRKWIGRNYSPDERPELLPKIPSGINFKVVSFPRF